MNFQVLAMLDVFDLIASLPKRMGGFNDGKPRVLSILSPNGEAVWDGWDKGMWPEFSGALGRLEGLGGGIELGGAFLEMLDPGVCIGWRRKSGEYYEAHQRVYLPLRTNPGCMMFSGIESANPQIGALTLVNVRVPHSSINLGDWSRIALVVDFRRKT